jgi:hypothetical protein
MISVFFFFRVFLSPFPATLPPDYHWVPSVGGKLLRVQRMHLVNASALHLNRIQTQFLVVEGDHRIGDCVFSAIGMSQVMALRRANQPESRIKPALEKRAGQTDHLIQ